jgi:hypothetical protein
MTTVMVAETLENLHCSTWLNPKDHPTQLTTAAKVKITKKFALLNSMYVLATDYLSKCVNTVVDYCGFLTVESQACCERKT